MKKIYNAVAGELELPQLTPEPRYLKCEAITGEWWYKDMQTGKDLPMFTTPIDWTHHDTLTLNQEKVFNEFVENVIDPIEQCQKLQQRIDKALGFLKNCNYKDDQFVVYIIKLLQGEDND